METTRLKVRCSQAYSVLDRGLSICARTVDNDGQDRLKEESVQLNDDSIVSLPLLDSVSQEVVWLHHASDVSALVSGISLSMSCIVSGLTRKPSGVTLNTTLFPIPASLRTVSGMTILPLVSISVM